MWMAYMYVCACVYGSHRQCWASFLAVLYLTVATWSLTEPGAKQFGWWLAHKLQGSVCLYGPRARLLGTCCHIYLFCIYLRLNSCPHACTLMNRIPAHRFLSCLETAYCVRSSVWLWNLNFPALACPRAEIITELPHLSVIHECSFDNIFLTLNTNSGGIVGNYGKNRV